MLDFANERYVCLYTRDTTTWKRLPWQARMLLPNILRKCDRSGMISLEGMTPAECVALHCDLPIGDFLLAALPPLFRPMDPNDPSTAVLQLTASAIFWPRFAEGQDTAKSDKQRQRESRESRQLRAKQAARSATQEELFQKEPSRCVTDPVDLGFSQNVTARIVASSQTVTDLYIQAVPSHDVTESMSDSAICHDVTPDVTPAEPSEPAEPSNAEPGRAESHRPNVVHFRRPLPSEPPGLPPPTPPLWRQILKWHADSFAQALAGLSPPRSAKRDEAAKVLAQKCEELAAAYRSTPEVLAQRIVDGLFQNHKAAQNRFPIGFAANDPLEYLPPPPGSKALPKPLTKSGPGDVSQTHESEAHWWLRDAPSEAVQ